MKIDAEKLITYLEAEKESHKIKFLFFGKSKADKIAINTIDKVIRVINQLSIIEEQKQKDRKTYNFDIDLFDEMNIYHDCTVQVLHNTITDEYSVGWWQN